MTSVIVVGAGAIGLATAYHLRAAGCDVSVIEAREPGEQASAHNAGWVIPSMSTPVPAPGMLLQAARWMSRSDSPLYVSPSLRPSFLGFMLRMLRSCTAEQFRRGTETLAWLSAGALESFDDLVSDGIDFEMHSQHLTMLFQHHEKADARIAELEQLEGVLTGLSWRTMSASELATHTPTLASTVVTGIESEGDRTVDPASFTRALGAACRRAGVQFHTQASAELHDTAAGTAVHVSRSGRDAEVMRADRIVVAAGAWTNEVLAPLGARIALQAGKGYGYDLPVGADAPSAPLYLAESKVAITPLHSKVRLAGTMGFGRARESIDRRRAHGIISGTRSFFADWPRVSPDARPWVGLRPMTPDGLPVIGPVRDHADVLVATGHAMLGVSLAPVTGRLVAELVTGATSGRGLERLQAHRF